MVSKTITKTNGKDKVIDFRDNLVVANTQDYANIHGVGGKAHAPNSTIRCTICDFTKGKGENSVTVSANIAVDVINRLYCVAEKQITNSEQENVLQITQESLNNFKQVYSALESAYKNTGIGKGDVWDNSAMSLLKALILRVERGHDFKKMGKQSIGDAYEMIQNPMGEIFLDSMFNPNSLKRDEQVCIGPYMTFKQGSDNMRGNIISGLATRMQVFQNEVIRKITAVDDIDLTLPAIKPCAYFCIMSDQHTTLNFLSTLFFTYAFMDQVEYADMNGGKCPVPVNYLLEEFPNIGIIPDCEKKVATVRSRDINISIIFQDIMQMKNRYPYSWSSILGNCDTHLFLGCNDEDTAQYISNRSGETTVKVSTVQHAKVESMFTVGHNHSSGDGRRKIFTPDEIRTFPLDKELIMFRGKHIMEAYKYDFSLHPESKKFNRIYIQNRPSIDDNIGRAEYKAEMNLYMQKYIDSVAFKTDLEKDIKSNDYVKVAKADIDLQDIDYSEYEDDSVCVIDDDLSFQDIERINKESVENDMSETIKEKDIFDNTIINNIPNDNIIKKNTVEPPDTQRVFKYRAN